MNEFQTYYIGHIANSDEQQQLMEAFQAFDKNGDGFIELDELMKCMSELTEEEAKEMISMADKNGDGKVNYAGDL